MQNVSGRIPELDGLRGIAIAMVLFFHAAVYVPFGWTPLESLAALGWSGVDLFFVLSGFLIGGILIDQRESGAYFSTFYARRAFRILPVYLAIIACYGIIFSLNGPFRGNLIYSVGPPMAWWAYLTFTNNIYLAAHGMGFFLPTTWSLAVEEQFYLTLPLLVRLLPPRWFTRVILFLTFAISMSRAIACSAGLASQNEAYVLPWFRIDALLIGVVCAIVVRSPRMRDLIWRRRSQFYGLLVLLAISVWKIGWWLPSGDSSPAVGIMEFGLTLLAVLYGEILLTAVLACPPALSSFLRWRPLRFLGGISYFVYLVHQPLLTSAVSLLPDMTGWQTWQKNLLEWTAIAIAYALAMFLGHLSWKYFESRMIALGHRWRFTSRSKQEEYVPPAEELAA